MLSGVASPPVEPNDALWDRIQIEQAEIFDSSRARVHHLARAVRQHGPVLNIGIGAGYLEQELIGWGTPVHTIDPSARSVAMLQEKIGLGDEIRVGRAEQLPFASDFFGAVVVAEVLEHLTTPVLRQALAEIHRVLRPRGFIIGTVPARENLAAQTVDCPTCQCHFHRWGHYQSFNRDSMRSLLAETFSVDEVFERPFVCWRTLNWVGRLAAAVKMGLYYLGRHGSSENVVFRASKTPARQAILQQRHSADPLAV
ncbi:MAG TPA: class I SAM-dependent methyltransferase [Pirellulales bacterium]|jgi:SAM-dependent methyltransferase|nr:class I SAM-dependent methyltransferase [Pirellulales bacterium]